MRSPIQVLAAAARTASALMRTAIAGAIVGAGVVLAVAGTAAPAQAHATLESSSPADRATVATPPAKVVLRFDEPVGSKANALTVTTADGTRWDAGDAAVLDSKLTASIKPGGPGGVWTVSWRVVSADGHPVSGQLHFTVTGRPAPTAAPTDAASSASAGTLERVGPGTAAIVAIVVVVLLVLGGLAVRFGRPGRSDD